MSHKAGLPGPVLISLESTVLTAEEQDWLQHPATGGLTLFTRNFSDTVQLGELCAAIREAAHGPVLICVDHEGGRVQRFRSGFTRLPPLGVLGRIHTESPAMACDLAYRHARVMAGELLLHGVDLSFAPVLDLDGASCVIGDRAMAADPGVVAELGAHYLAGMQDAGMRTCGKHFPGHGSVLADSHLTDVVDDRPLAELEAGDLLPFRRLLGRLDSLMMAHVIYPRVDANPAGYSSRWINGYLRGTLAYSGVVFSDDLGMRAAYCAGSLKQRLEVSLAAGCDAVLVCQPAEVRELLGSLDGAPGETGSRLMGLLGRSPVTAEELEMVGEWRHWTRSLAQLAMSQ